MYKYINLLVIILFKILLTFQNVSIYRTIYHKTTTTIELALKQKQQLLQQRLKSLSRSSSQDQQNYQYNSQHHQPQQQHLINSSPQKSSEQQQQQQTITGSPVRPNVSYPSNWRLLRQHTTTHSLDNSDILNCTRGNAGKFFNTIF